MVNTTVNKGGAPLGNRNNAKGKESTRALEMALDKKGGKVITPIGRMQPLVEMWEKVVEEAVASGDLARVKEITDRLDGRPNQTHDVDMSATVRRDANEFSDDELAHIATGSGTEAAGQEEGETQLH